MPKVYRYDYATIKYDTGGNQLWVARYNGPGNWDDAATAIAVDDSCNVYVTGESYSSSSSTSGDYATIKYDTNGNELWVRGYNGPGNEFEFAAAIAVDNSGNVYVTGVSAGSSTGGDYATIKYAQCLSPITGDLNDDCKVNFIDFAIFAMAWLGDDLTDISIIAENWLECNWSDPNICL